MPARRDAQWWRDYRVRRRLRNAHPETVHKACDERERRLMERIAALEARVRELKEIADGPF